MSVVPDKYRGSKEYHMAFCRLIAAARNRGTVTYQELGKMLGLPLRGSHFGREIGLLLGEISEDEHQNQRPMLSAIAVNAKGQPGGGFFELARDLGKLSADSDEKDFWEGERSGVYETWEEKHETYSPK